MATITASRPVQAPNSQVKYRHARRRTQRALAMTFMFCFLLYFFVPLYWLMVSATKSSGDLFSTFGLWFSPDFNLFTNLQQLFSYDDGIFLNWTLNTIFYAVCSSVGATMISTLAGYTFAKYHFPGRGLIFAIILGSIMVPGAALTIPIYLLMSKATLINTPWAIILPSLVSPFGVYLMRVYAEQSVPDELMDAARVDGAGELRILWSIASRLLVPGFITVLLLSFVGSWNSYFLPLLVLSDEKLYPLTVGLASWNFVVNGSNRVLYSLVLTGALVSIVPLVAAFLFLQRYWQNGLAFGSVKN